MFNQYTNLDVTRFWQFLGTFYNYIPEENKAIIEAFWKALLDGVEGLYYNLGHKSIIDSLTDSQGYIENSLQEYIISFDRLTTEKYSPPLIVSGYVTTPDIENQTYLYKVTSLTPTGESSGSDPFVVKEGSSDLSSNPISIIWNLEDGVSNYNVYRYESTSGAYKLIDSTTGNSFTDSGQTLQNYFVPKTNSALKEYIYEIPDNFYHLSMPTLSGLHSNVLLTEGVDYTISGLRYINFNGVSGMLPNDVYYCNQGIIVSPILTNLYFVSFGAEDDPSELLRENQYLPYLSNWGSLSYNDKNIAWVKHLMKWTNAVYLRMSAGPTMLNLKETLDLLFNVPFNYEGGVITTITNSGGYYYITIGDYEYKIPDSLTIKKAVGDYVNALELLTEGVTLVDYKTNEVYMTTLPNLENTDFEPYNTLVIQIPDEIFDLGYYDKFINFYITSLIPPGIRVRIYYNGNWYWYTHLENLVGHLSLDDFLSIL